MNNITALDLGERVIVRLRKDRVMGTVVKIYPHDPSFVGILFDSGITQDVRSTLVLRTL